MSLLLFFNRQSSPRLISAGIATLALTPIGSSLRPEGTIRAGIATLRLVVQGSWVGAVITVAPAAPSTQEQLEERLAGSHQPRARLVTLSPTRTVRSTYNPATLTLSGSVSFDRRREVRRSGSLVLVDPDGTHAPTGYGDEFAQGELLRLDRGMQLGAANVYDLLGVFEIATFGAELSGALTLSLEDPSVALQQDIGTTLTLRAGTTAEEVLRRLWEPVLGDGSGWELDGAGMAVTEPRTVGEDEQLLHVAVSTLADLGLEVFMSRSGYPVMRPLADPNALSPVRTYRQDRGEARATSIRRSGDQRPYNRFVVIGEPPTGAVIRAEADITDPASPLHADRIGLRVAPIYRSSQITTHFQARQVARARLIEASLWADSVLWVGLPDPALEAGDVVRIIDAQTGTDASYRLDRVVVPVAQGEMSLEASRVVPLFEGAAVAPPVGTPVVFIPPPQPGYSSGYSSGFAI